MSAVPDRSGIGPYLGGLRVIFGGVRWTWDSPRGFLGRAIFSESAASVVPDRSEIGPYLGGPRVIFGGCAMDLGFAGRLPG